MQNPSNTSFQIRDVKIDGPVILAPMDGYTDAPFRSLCRNFGSSASYSEFINGIDVVNSHPYLKYKIYFHESERPFAYQVFDDNPERLFAAAVKLAGYDPDYIDINMGCSARNVSNRGAGAGLLKEPQKISLMVHSLVQSLKIPITAKIRLGWDDQTKNYLEIIKILEGNGISAIAVHGRTRKQEYSGKADWEAIGEIKRFASVPIIGNGDVYSYQNALDKVERFKCDAVMIGRAALGNPWIFSGTDRNQVSTNERYSVIEAHLSGMCSLYGSKYGTILFRKHIARYMIGYMPTSETRQLLFSYEQPEELLIFISSLLNQISS